MFITVLLLALINRPFLTVSRCLPAQLGYDRLSKAPSDHFEGWCVSDF